jgi:hypothetical protein
MASTTAVNQDKLLTRVEHVLMFAVLIKYEIQPVDARVLERQNQLSLVHTAVRPQTAQRVHLGKNLRRRGTVVVHAQVQPGTITVNALITRSVLRGTGSKRE